MDLAQLHLGTPLLAGPGAIAATMLYIQQLGTIGDWLSVLLALTGVHLVVWLGMRYSGIVGRLLGDNGIELVSRLLGFILAAMAVELVASAVAEWVRVGVD